MGASTPEDFEQAVASASPRRLMMLHFAVVAAAYERALTKDTWRTDMPPSEYGGADRRHARVWLEFCREVGHNLAPIEVAIVADEPYTPTNLPAASGTLPGAQDTQNRAAEDAQDGGDEQAGDEAARDQDGGDETGPTPGEPQQEDDPGPDDLRGEDGAQDEQDPDRSDAEAADAV